MMENVEVKKAKKIRDITPIGHNILFELLDEKELNTTSFIIPEKSKKDVGKDSAPQAIILKLGKAVEADKLGLTAGSRCLIQGTYVPAPDYGNNKRKRGICSPMSVFAVLEEEEEVDESDLETLSV